MNKSKVMNMAHSAQIRGQQAGREYEQYREVYLYILHMQIWYVSMSMPLAGRLLRKYQEYMKENIILVHH